MTKFRPAFVQRTCGAYSVLTLAMVVLMLAGCGGSSGGPAVHTHTPTPTATPTPTPGEISGVVFGGSPTVGVPIGGSVVTVFQAGASGYGSAPRQLGQGTTGADGSFSIHISSCQSSGFAQQIYVVAIGGTSQGQSQANPAIAMIAALGPCAAPVNEVVINEVSTIATVWALDQFMDPTGQQIGTSATNEVGLANAEIAMTLNFVDLNTGLAPESIPDGLTSPTATLYSLANILVGCVDSAGISSDGCQQLFTAATPPGGAAPTTTLQSALNIVLNPTNNVSNLFALVPQVNPTFAPVLPAAPGSWVAELNYDPSAAEFNAPYSLALDSLGNVFVVNAGGNSVSELVASSGYTTAFNYAPSGAAMSLPTLIAIDTSNNLWIANNAGNSISELTQSSGYSTGLSFSPSAAMINTPSYLNLDAAGNVWVANTGNDSVSELLSGCSATSCNGINFNNSNTGSPGANFSTPASLIADVIGNVWVGNLGGSSITELPAGCTSASCTAVNFNNSNTGSPGAGFNQPIEVDIDALGDVWAANFGGNSVSELPAGCTSSSCNGANFSNGSAQFQGPSSIAIDTSNNVFVTNETGNTVSELTAASAYATAFNFGAWSLQRRQFYVAIDSGGNLWIVNNYDSTVTEVPGLATPVLTPAQACLVSGKDVCLP
jgi:hypothetical protein